MQIYTTVDYATKIGTYILTFGNLEETIHRSIILICNKNFCNNTKLTELIDKMLISISSVYKKLELLEYLINLIELDEENQNLWQDFFDKTKELITRRNIYAHNMYGIKSGTFFKFKARTKTNEKITLEKLDNDIKELEERYRQLFDSIIQDFTIGKSTWISKYPRLNYFTKA